MDGLGRFSGLEPAARRAPRAPRAAVSVPKQNTPAEGAFARFSRRDTSTLSQRFGPDAAGERNTADFREHGDG